MTKKIARVNLKFLDTSNDTILEIKESLPEEVQKLKSAFQII